MGKKRGANANANLAGRTSKAAKNVVVKELTGVDALFQKYADKENVIGPEKIESLCMDLGIEVMDVRALMLAWKMQAAKQGYFTLEEWQRGLESLRVDTIDKLRKALPALEKEVMDPKNFEDFYTYAFKYCLTEERQKWLDIESVCILFMLVLAKCYQAEVESFVDYLKDQKVKAMNHDQWQSFLRFCKQFRYPDFKKYDSSQAWPSLLDEYVEWAKKMREG